MKVATNVLANPSTKLRYTYKTKPYAHQKKALNKLLQLDGKAGLFMEMSTGKTKVALDWAGIGFHNWGTRRVVVVAPLSVLGVWPRQIRQHLGAPSRIFRIPSTTSSRRVRLLKRITASRNDEVVTFIILNYEALWREDDKGVSVQSVLIRWKPDLIIFDESHRIKNSTSRQSKAAWKIALASRQRLALTGTSISKSPLDAFGQFRAVNQDVFGTNWREFRNYYGMWSTFVKYKLKGYRHLNELIGKIRKNSYIIKREQCLDLPPKVFVTVPVQLTDVEKNYYNQMVKESIIQIEETHATAAIVLAKALRLRQITSGFIKDVEGNIRIFGNSKLNVCMDLIDDLLEEEHKVVVYFEFIKDIERVSEQLTKRKVRHHKLSGSVPDRKRDSLKDDFQRNPNTKVFLVQIQTGSEGIELYAADSVIYYSLTHNAVHYWQSQDRVNRTGQTADKVTYYHLAAPKSMDEVMIQAHERRLDVAMTILHKPRKLLQYI